MRRVLPIARLEAIVGRLAIAIGALCAIAVPTSYVTVAYVAERDLRFFQATQAADRVAQYAYISGPTWRFAAHRVAELAAQAVPARDSPHQTVRDAEGRMVVSIGELPPWPRLESTAAITARNQVIGSVTLETTLMPMLPTLLATSVIGLTLGGLVHFSIYRWPLRALRRTIDTLLTTQARLLEKNRIAEEALATARLEKERALIANRSKTEFLANMSHELRTPLNAIIGFSAMMQDALVGPLSERYQDYARDINVSGQHLLDIINDILDIAKIEAGHLEPRLSPLDAVEIVGACQQLVGNRAREAGLTLLIDGHGPAMVLADAVRLKQVLLNLLSNAIKFTPKGGTVTVSFLRNDRPGWDVVVADTGIGMTPAEIELALQPFRQVDSSLNRKFEGTGLGLPLARRLTELQGGAFHLSSRPGRGTTVVVVLPGVEAGATAHEPLEPSFME